MNTTQLTRRFRRVSLVPARERGHPYSDPDEGYDLLLPLDRDSRLDQAEWKTHPHLCRIRRFRAKNDPSYGHLRRKPDGQWYIEYSDGKTEVAFHWSDEHFVEEEYFSIKSGETMHTYRITLVERP
jgi:hypothetical protein